MRIITSPLEKHFILADGLYSNYLIIHFNSKAERKRFDKMLENNIVSIKKELVRAKLAK